MVDPRPRPGARWRRLLARWTLQLELHERMLLLRQPWREEFLHWSADGALHGHRLPPPGGRAGTTRSGWCPGGDQAPVA